MGYYLNAYSTRHQYAHNNPRLANRVYTQQRSRGTRGSSYTQRVGKPSFFPKLFLSCFTSSTQRHEEEGSKEQHEQRDGNQSHSHDDAVDHTVPTIQRHPSIASTTISTTTSSSSATSNTSNTPMQQQISDHPLMSPSLTSTSAAVALTLNNATLQGNTLTFANSTTPTYRPYGMHIHDIEKHFILTRLSHQIFQNRDLLLSIIQYLDWCDILVKVRALNHYFNDITHQCNVFTHLKTLSLAYQYGVNSEVKRKYTSIAHNTHIPASVSHSSGTGDHTLPTPRSSISHLLLIYRHECHNDTKHFTSLDLSYSDVTDHDIPIIQLYGNHSITSLNLNGCTQLTDTICSTYLSSLKNLQKLNVCHTKFTFRSLPIIGTFSSLRTLSLSAQSSLNSPCTSYLGTLTNLEKLTLSGMALTDNDLLYLSTLRRLQVLQCIGLQVQRQQIQGSAFGERLGIEWKGLRTLHLIQSEISDTGLLSLATHFHNLTELNLSHSYRLTDTCMKSFVECRVIREQLLHLDISFCSGISDAGLVYLPYISRLQTLSMRGCCISDESIVDLFYGFTYKDVPLMDLDISGFHVLISPDHRVDDYSLQEMVDAHLMKHLHTLRILGCHRITAECISTTLAYHPSLNCIYVDEGKLKRHHLTQMRQIRQQLQYEAMKCITIPR